MRTIGLTGGIGSGKSEVARGFAARGAVVIDADALAREVVAPGTEGLAEVVGRFGEDVLHADGSLDRERLGEIVFADEAELAALNAIVHPRVAARTEELINAAAEDAVVVYDVPLLVENGLESGFDTVVVVDAPVEVQLHRLTTVRGMSTQQAEARIGAQASRESRRAVADIVIDNSGSLAELHETVAKVWRELTG
jgi:dephospho-CoA kinase